MAQNLLDISILSPLKFHVKDYANPAPYNTKFDDDWAYPETIPDFYEHKPFYQPFQQNDIIYLQLLSNFAPHNVELLDCQGNQIDTFEFAYVNTSVEGTGQKVYECHIALDVYPEGKYFVRISSGTPTVLITMESELFWLKAFHPNSVQLKYSHDENDHGVVFETGIEFIFRVFGGFPLEQYKPGSDKTLYIDQTRNAVLLDGKSWDIDRFLLGDASGVPKWVVKKFNKILLCSSVLYDGKQFTVNDAGASLDATNEALYPMAGWGIDLRPADNAPAKRFTSDGDSDNPTTVVYNIESEGFGPITGPASSNIIKIQSLD